MLHLLDESLERFLRTCASLPARDVDVAFDAPDRDWAAGISKPTVDLYLWDVRPNTDQQEYGLLQATDDQGRVHRISALPRVDCRYLVTAWTSEVRDEHALLGRVLTGVLLHDSIDAEHLVGALADVRPIPTVELRSGHGGDNSDFWSALGGQLKPGLDLVITVTVDAAELLAAGPRVDSVTLRYGRIGEDQRAEAVVATAEGSKAG